MRNLKRALSLVMAMALIVGMMVVSASAASKDFTDKDEIRHTEAVNTMVALNVISGKEDGSYFDPTGIVTPPMTLRSSHWTKGIRSRRPCIASMNILARKGFWMTQWNTRAYY